MECSARPEVPEKVARSRRVSSPQCGRHPGLERILRRHSECRYRRPVSAFSRLALEPLYRSAQRSGTPVVLDLGCGVGESTAKLGTIHPQARVIGVDKSSVRLSRFDHASASSNVQLIRADSIDALMLAKEIPLSLEAVYLWYPNPWPKKKHLQRRWHAHAVFPTLLSFQCPIELRTNWQLYAEEFAFALRFLGVHDVDVETFRPTEYHSPFERKYARSGQTLYRVQTLFPPRDARSIDC